MRKKLSNEEPDASLVPDTAPNPFTKKRKRRVKNCTKLLTWVRHICNGCVHYVGLTTKGSLIFSHHTIKELEQFLMLASFGEKTCTCAGILGAWREGRLTDALPLLLSRERPVWNEFKDDKTMKRPSSCKLLGFRIMQRRRRQRDIDSYQGKDHPLPAGTESISVRRDWTRQQLSGAVESTWHAAADKIIQLLKSWGWSDGEPTEKELEDFQTKPCRDKSGKVVCKKTLPPKKRYGPCLERDSTGVMVRLQSSAWLKNNYNNEYKQPTADLLKFNAIHNREHPFIKCFVGPYAKSHADCLIRSGVGLQDWDLRYLTDMAEYGLLWNMINSHNGAFRVYTQEDMENRATLLNDQLNDKSFKAKLVDKEQALYELDITFSGLNIHAAERLLKKIREMVLPVVKTAKNTSNIRCRAKLRTPAPTRNAVGVVPFKPKAIVQPATEPAAIEQDDDA